ncbi:IclR family transcriptional regulator [Hoeflea sp. TYP-13]|uniref:IclR family transcriptional regulator n=1 Tax=Hoeflea sp. TYP-13 TaxID=3230023 RepID=UPI0034C6C468
MATLQTLDRGISALQIIAARRDGVGVATLAEELGVDRAIAYRIAATLEERALISRTAGGRLILGVGVLELATQFGPQLRIIAQPILSDLARRTSATAFISVASGEECAALSVAEPDEGLLRVGYRVGSRHPIDRGAAGIAILAGRKELPDDSDAVKESRRLGFSVTRGELQPGAVGVASPILPDGRQVASFEASVGVVAMEDLDVDTASVAVVACAKELASFVNR